MEPTLWLGLIVFTFEIIVAAVAAVWVVATIKTTTAKLGVHIESLSNSVSRLDQSVESLDSKLDSHAERLAKLGGRDGGEWGGVGGPSVGRVAVWRVG